MKSAAAQVARAEALKMCKARSTSGKTVVEKASFPVTKEETLSYISPPKLVGRKKRRNNFMAFQSFMTHLIQRVGVNIH